MKDASLAGSVAMLFVFITGLSTKRTAKQKNQTGNTGNEEFDERQQIIKLKGAKLALSVMVISYSASWVLKSCGFDWFGSSFLDMIFPIFCTAIISVSYVTWYDVDYPLKAKESHKKKWNVGGAIFGMLVLCGAVTLLFVNQAMYLAVIMFMFAALFISPFVAYCARAAHDKHKKTSDDEEQGEE